ncbi:hypothetical protein ACNKHR_23855 [Shigella flexneri]
MCGCFVSDLIGDALNNPDLALLIKTLSLAFVVIPLTVNSSAR